MCLEIQIKQGVLAQWNIPFRNVVSMASSLQGTYSRNIEFNGTTGGDEIRHRPLGRQTRYKRHPDIPAFIPFVATQS